MWTINIDFDVCSEYDDIVAEARQSRFWRDRCGEPLPTQFPIRCQRDLQHDSPHVGLGWSKQRGDYALIWEGHGNTLSAQATRYKCWCKRRA